MSMSTLEELNKLIAEQVRQQVQNQQGAQAAPVQTTSFGLPTQPMMQPMGMPTQQPIGQMPQPIGVSVPVTVPLPDGRELSVRVEFGPEAAQNLQAVAAMAVQLFGPYLQARNPWRGGGGGYGGNFQGGWNGRRNWR